MQRIVWTDALDAKLRALRFAGVTWDAIAVLMSMGRNSVLERGRKIGARRENQVIPLPEPEEPRDRPCLEAGHPRTWGMLTAGTSLEGSPYPYPVFGAMPAFIRRPAQMQAAA